MDAQQLTILPGRTVWSLSDEAVRTGDGSWVDSTPWWLLEAAEPQRPDSTTEPAVPAAGEEPTRGRSKLALAVVTAAVVAIGVTVGIAFLTGMRWFVVETPSMGTAAPVGTLVLTAPEAGPLHAGEVIAFTPPGVPRTYTHRVFSVAADGSVRTKGDIDAAPDPWTIPRSAVIGHAVALLPGAGWAIRGMPVLLAGSALVLLLTMPLRSRARRASARIIGLHLVATGVLLWLHPLVGIVLIASERVGDVVKASIVSTGLLPIRLVDSAGDVLARLGDGTPQLVSLPAAAQGVGRITAVPDLGWHLQLALILVAAFPALIVLVVGLPRDPSDAA